MHMGIDMQRRNVAALVVAASLAAGTGIGCSVEEPSPSMTGPSEFATSIALAASPDQLPRDGSSQSMVTATVRNEAGRPVSGQRLAVSTNVGTVSQSEVVTGEDGRATFAFVAPGAGVGFSSAAISVTPIGGTTRTSFARTLNIPLTGRSGVTSAREPIALFTFSPTAPTQGDIVTFDASTSTDEGTTVRCLDLCTYSWDFGGEATGSGRVTTYRFQSARTYSVTLTVTDAAGSTGTSTQNVAVTQGTLPTATFSISPTSPAQFETVNFTAAASTVGVGRTITSYQWRFGDGTTATGVTTSHAYNVIGTYNVQLTVTDSAGLQHSTTQAVTVVNGVTASFTSSNPTDGSLTVFFNAEESRGSSTGFGTRSPITKYIWNFGHSTDVEETTSSRISHTFPFAATYTVTLTVEDSAGRRQTTSSSITVAN
jgi:PKD repeat protein